MVTKGVLGWTKRIDPRALPHLRPKWLLYYGEKLGGSKLILSRYRRQWACVILWFLGLITNCILLWPI
jgi:hypothetical protein